MNTETIIGVSIIALTIQIIVLYMVISTATNTKRKVTLAEIQVQLLARIAEKLNVPVEQIRAAINKL